MCLPRFSSYQTKKIYRWLQFRPTVVRKVLVDKQRVFNRRFQALASHYLFEPIACTPTAGGEKGQVERQVGVVRQWFLAKRSRFTDLEELNQWLRDECRALTGKNNQSRPGTEYPFACGGTREPRTLSAARLSASIEPVPGS